MSLVEWLTAFCALHDRAKQGQLNVVEKKAYRDAQDHLVRAVMNVQRLPVGKGKPREMVRVPRALAVEFELPSGWVTALTRDLGFMGFSALLPSAPTAGALLRCRLKLAHKQDTVEGQVRVVDVKEQGGTVQAAFAFEKPRDEDATRIQMFVLDCMIEMFKPGPGRST